MVCTLYSSRFSFCLFVCFSFLFGMEENRNWKISDWIDGNFKFFQVYLFKFSWEVWICSILTNQATRGSVGNRNAWFCSTDQFGFHIFLMCCDVWLHGSQFTFYGASTLERTKLDIFLFQNQCVFLWLDLLGIFEVQPLFEMPFPLNSSGSLWRVLFIQYKHISISVFAISSFYFLLYYLDRKFEGFYHKRQMNILISLCHLLRDIESMFLYSEFFSCDLFFINLSFNKFSISYITFLHPSHVGPDQLKLKWQT